MKCIRHAGIPLYTVIIQIVSCKLDSSGLTNPLLAMIASSFSSSRSIIPSSYVPRFALDDSNILVKMRLIQSTVPVILVKEALAL